MLGINVILKCPYCKQVLTCNLGVTQYYTYENRKVITMVHCNKEFVCEYATPPALEFSFNLVKWRRKYRNLWSIPMTEEIEKNLIPSHTICW